VCISFKTNATAIIPQVVDVLGKNTALERKSPRNQRSLGLVDCIQGQRLNARINVNFDTFQNYRKLRLKLPKQVLGVT